MKKILIADDEPIERQVVCKKITSAYGSEVEVHMAANGLEAVEIFNDKRCDVVILDIAMPGMNGIDAASIIRKQAPQCPIIFLTAFDDFNYAKKAIEIKALDYLLKPTTDEELFATIEEAFSICDSIGQQEEEQHLAHAPEHPFQMQGMVMEDGTNYDEGKQVNSNSKKGDMA